MAKKTLYKTVFTVEVLSEEPLPDGMTLTSIDEEITEGHSSGAFKETKSVTISGKEAVEAVKAQGSDPSFFQMDEEGNEIEEEF